MNNQSPTAPQPETGARHSSLGDSTAQKILAAVASLRYGSVEITVHDGRVVQVEKRERTRITTP